MKSISSLLFAACSCLVLQAQPAALFSDRGVPQISFAASEICRALAAQGASLAETGMENLAANKSPLRFVIAGSPGESQRLAQRHHVGQPAQIERNDQCLLATCDPVALGRLYVGTNHLLRVALGQGVTC